MSSQDPQDPQAASGPLSKLLSCTRCRQRKTKCNKANPCDSCQRAGVPCDTPSRRSRAPRRRHRALEARDAELLLRIKRLESLVGKGSESDAANTMTMMDSAEGSPRHNVVNSNPAPTLFLNNDAFDERAQTGVRLDASYASFVKRQSRGNRYPFSDFWTSLGDEFDGIRQLLEHPLENDEDDTDDLMSNPPESKDSSPHFIFEDPGSLGGIETSYPSESHRATLFQFYFANVAPICKVLHRPTANTYLSGADELLNHTTGRFKFGSIEACTFAMYFAAVTSMSTQDCMTHFGEEKHVLLARYRRSTETALTQADFMNSREIVTLQAFTLYIVSTPSIICVSAISTPNNA